MLRILISIIFFLSLSNILSQEKYTVIEYTSSTAAPVEPCKLSGFDGILISNTYEKGKGKMVFYPNNGDHLTMIGDSAFVNCDDITSMIIPEGITRIGFRAFAPARKLFEVKLPSTLDSLDRRAFHGAHLLNVDIPNGIRTISYFAFSFSWLTHVTVPNSVKILDTSAFECCYYLQDIYLPESITFISNYAFANCPSLRSIYYSGTMEQWTKIKKANQWYVGGWQNTPLNVIHCSDGDISVNPHFNHPDEQATYSLDISGCQWATMCFPICTSDIPDGLSVYRVEGIDDPQLGTLVIKPVEQIIAFKPYLVNGPEGQYSFTGYKYDIPESYCLYTGLLYGTLNDTELTDNNSYVLQDKNGKVAFYRIDGNNTITLPANKAYLYFQNSPAKLSNFRFTEENQENIIQYNLEETNRSIIYNIYGRRMKKQNLGINVIINNKGKTNLIYHFEK